MMQELYVLFVKMRESISFFFLLSSLHLPFLHSIHKNTFVLIYHIKPYHTTYYTNQTIQTKSMENPTPTPLGTMAHFPSEIRDHIWLQFVPSGHETNHPKTDLSILRTNHVLHDKVSRVIYGKSHLEIDISPEHEHDHEYKDEDWKWMTVQFSQHHYHYSQTTFPLDPPQRGRWVIRNTEDARSRGLYDLSWYRIDQVTVRLEAPRFRDTAQLYTIWRKVTDLVDLLQHASAINTLTIWLVNGDGRDWVEEDKDEPGFRSNMDVDPGHEMVILPFYNLRNLQQQIHIKTQSSNQTKTIENRIVHDTETLDRKCAEHYFHLHSCLWMAVNTGSLANILRLRLLREWVSQSNGDLYHERSDLEKNMQYIMDVYPDIIKKYDRGMAFSMSVMISGNHHAQAQSKLKSKSQVTNGSTDMNEGQDIWDTVFPNGIPSMSAREFDEEIDTLFTGRCASFWCTDRQVSVEDWRLGRRVGVWICK